MLLSFLVCWFCVQSCFCPISGREWIELGSNRLAQYRTETKPSYQDHGKSCKHQSLSQTLLFSERKQVRSMKQYPKTRKNANIILYEFIWFILFTQFILMFVSPTIFRRTSGTSATFGSTTSWTCASGRIGSRRRSWRWTGRSSGGASLIGVVVGWWVKTRTVFGKILGLNLWCWNRGTITWESGKCPRFERFKRGWSQENGCRTIRFLRFHDWLVLCWLHMNPSNCGMFFFVTFLWWVIIGLFNLT